MVNLLRKKRVCLYAGIAAVVCIAVSVAVRDEKPGSFRRIDRVPVVDPDYSGVVIPPNIAPLNFAIREAASRYHVKIYAATGDTIRVNAGGKAPVVNIPVRKWKRLLQSNRGAILTIEIYEKSGGVWRRFNPITNKIALEAIDGCLVYRTIFGYRSIPEMEIRQRNLENFDETVVLNNRTLSTTSLACINCHSFCNNDPDTMIIHQRGREQGMLLVRGKKIVKIDTRTNFNRGPASYASWHPSGDLIAFAVMKVNQVLHSVDDPRIVIDEASDLIVYNVTSNLISTHPSIADSMRMETLPEWSPDGRWLYFCSAPRPEKIDEAFYNGLQYRDIKYDLMRIPFDGTTGTWGTPETLVSAKETAMSNVHPKLSPDGRYLLFVMMPYSYFAVYNDSSNLYLMDLSTMKYRRLDALNSGYAESFHSWSSNGRWFVFSSRRRDGLCARPYFACVDTAGVVSKPFILPQRDPALYTTLMQSFNVPVLVKKPVTVSWRDLSKAAGDRESEMSVRLDSTVRYDGVTTATWSTGQENVVP